MELPLRATIKNQAQIGSRKKMYYRSNNYRTYSANVDEFLESGHIASEMSEKNAALESRFVEMLEGYADDCNPRDNYSVYTGTSGAAYVFMTKFIQTQEEKYLKRAIKLVDSALPLLNKKRISFLNGDAGPLALGAVLHYLKKEESVANELLQKLLEINFEDKSHPDEVLYGRAGYLYSLLFVKKGSNLVVPKSVLKRVVHCILESGRKLARQLKHEGGPPLRYVWHEKNYLGAAHGVAGIMYMLLEADDILVEEEDGMSEVEATINWLETQRYPSGNPKSSETSNDDRLVQWCHGAPGCIQMYLRAYKVFGDNKYLRLAEQLSDIIWERGLLIKGYSICHGVTGNAYAFLALFRQTRDAKYLYQAVCFADYCYTHPRRQSHDPDRPFSLYEGIAGLAQYMCDLRDPERAKFPAYEL